MFFYKKTRTKWIFLTKNEMFYCFNKVLNNQFKAVYLKRCTTMIHFFLFFRNKYRDFSFFLQIFFFFFRKHFSFCHFVKIVGATHTKPNITPADSLLLHNYGLCLTVMSWLYLFTLILQSLSVGL